jgi:hypothetical protein
MFQIQVDVSHSSSADLQVCKSRQVTGRERYKVRVEVVQENKKTRDVVR